MIHIYYGDGKGKTTAAIGLAVRAAGCGKRVLICRFLKNNASGELECLKKLSGIEVMDLYSMDGFLSRMDECERSNAKACQIKLFEEVCKRIESRSYDMVVLDEALWLVSLEIVPESRVIQLLQSFSKDSELVLTGGQVSDALVEQADYVTCMKKICHPYDLGCDARYGIEF